MSHFHFIDGTMYTASPFGETDATTGEWKINTSPSAHNNATKVTLIKTKVYFFEKISFFEIILFPAKPHKRTKKPPNNEQKIQIILEIKILEIQEKPSQVNG